MIALLSLLDGLASPSIFASLFDAFDIPFGAEGDWDWREDFRLRESSSHPGKNEIFDLLSNEAVLLLSMDGRGEQYTMVRCKPTEDLAEVFAGPFRAIGLDPTHPRWTIDSHRLYGRLTSCDALWSLLRNLQNFGVTGSHRLALASRVAVLANDWDAFRLTDFGATEARPSRAMKAKEAAIQADAEALAKAWPDVIAAVELLGDPRGAALRLRVRREGVQQDIYLPACEVDWMPVVPIEPRRCVGVVAKYAVQASPLEEPVVAALMTACLSGTTARLTRKLTSKVFPKVKAAIEQLGGRWNSATQVYDFDDDPAERITEAIATRCILTDRDFEFFATQAPQVERMLELADLQPGQRVLEPQAGDGAIAIAAAGIVGVHNVSCYELMPRNVERLRGHGFDVAEPQDFLAVAPRAVFDVVLLNPPFSNGRDIAHTLHALKFVKPGGRLVSLMSTTWRQSSTAAAHAFRELLVELDAMTEDVPDGAFKAVGTMVPTVIVVVDVPEATGQAQAHASGDDSGLRDLFDNGLVLA